MTNHHNVLVTGAAGFVGRALCPALADAGYKVVAAVRDSRALAGVDMKGLKIMVVPDIGPDTDWTDALKGVDMVVHLAARAHIFNDSAADPEAEYIRVNVGGTRRLAKAAVDAGVRRFLYLSTIKVNGENSGDGAFSEDDAPAPSDAYGRTKRDAEKALLDIAENLPMEVVIVRPPLVYGAGAKGNMLRLIKICDKAIPLPFAAIANRRSMIYLGNLVDAIITCLKHDAAANNTYLVCDGDDVSTPELVRRIARSLGRPARLVYIPVSVLRLAGKIFGKSDMVSRLLDSLSINDQKIRTRLLWSPPFTMQQGMEETSAWFRSRQGR